MTLLIGILLLFFASSVSAQQNYKWKDEKGQWHFSQTSPQRVKTEVPGRALHGGKDSTKSLADPVHPSPTPLLTKNVSSKAGKLSSKLATAVDVLSGEFNSLRNSTAAVRRMIEIPLEMQREIDIYSSKMKALIVTTEDEALRRVLSAAKEATVTKSMVSVSQVKYLSSSFFRARCLKAAYRKYQEEWGSFCPSKGGHSDCGLSATTAHLLEDRLREARQECSKKYP